MTRWERESMSKEFERDRGSGVIGAMLVLSLLFFLVSLVVFATAP